MGRPLFVSLRVGSVLVLGFAIACGARTPLGADQGSASADGGIVDGAVGLSCTPDASATPRAPCTSWKLVGADQVIAPPPGTGAALGLSTPIVSGCGVVTGWYTSTGRDPPFTVTWSTRSIAFDGTPGTDVFSHPALTTQTMYATVMSLAANGASAAGLIADAMGCRFVPLDANGGDAGQVVVLGTLGCGAIAADGDGFSYLTPSAQSATPATLNRVNARGAARSSTALAMPAGRALWDRLVLDDGSFLVNSFREDTATGNYTDWLQHFDAQGAALASENVVINANTAPVLLAPSATGLLAAWDRSAVNVVSLDRDGRENGLVQLVSTTAALYGTLLVPVSGGDVLLLWWQDGTGRYDLFAQAMSPSGLPRGPATMLKSQSAAARFYAVADPRGDRAVLVFADDGVRAAELACVR